MKDIATIVSEGELLLAPSDHLKIMLTEEFVVFFDYIRPE